MDREKVLRGLECCIKSTWDDPFAECEHCPYNEISIYVQECRAVLSADALSLLKEPPDTVVRCRDCKHNDEFGCHKLGMIVSDSWFCADGKRRCDDEQKRLHKEMER